MDSWQGPYDDEPYHFTPYDDEVFILSKIAETRVERAVLKVIAFWYPKAKTERDGHIWLIKSAAEFREDQVDFAEDTIWRAIRALVKRDILVTERHYHPYKRTTGPVLWIRPTRPITDDTKFKKKKPPTATWNE